MMRMHTMAETPLVHLARFHYPTEEAHRDPEEETAPHYSLCFVERGGFDVRVGKKN